jgi:hypothetical protein
VNIKHVLLVALILVGCDQPQTDATSNKNQEAMAAFVNAHTITIAPESDKVRILTDGRLIPSSPTASANESFVVGVGESIKTSADEHAFSIFTYRSARVTSAVFDYETRFDQRSFGKNVVSIDRGEIEVAFRTGK